MHAGLRALLSNYYWCWDEAIGEVFADLPTFHGSPYAALASLTAEQRRRLETPAWQEKVDTARARQRAYLAGRPEQRTIAYFSAEFGVTETLPIYSGGLGVLAGDHIKAASDLGLPLVAVGLLYRRGYFRQVIDPAGWQREEYPELREERTGLQPELTDDGSPVIVTVPMGDHDVAVRVWRADIGRVPLYLLDTRVEQNADIDHWITAHLYGGDQDTRIRQEIVLGIGGVRALRELGYDALATYHMNEGHAAFLALELIRERIAGGLDFAAASALVREQCVFTTHTPVPAGHDAFPRELVLRYLGLYRERMLGCSEFELLTLGGWGAFSMTELALHLARSANGVSRKHGEVSQAMFPGRNIGSITNGVHHLTWTAVPFRRLYDQYLPGWRQEPDRLREAERLPGDAVRMAHDETKTRLIAYINEHHPESAFDPDTLTIGFARRFATYKRGTLLFRDAERLARVAGRRLQLVFAGKAHPRDDLGKTFIQSIIREIGQGPVRAVFLKDYDIRLGRLLTSGVDVWLNNPRRPLEASGTSGMKCLLNGIPNLSVLDGWWLEGYDATNGWAIGADYAGGDEDEHDAESLYTLLEMAVIPEYYAGDEAWLRRMRRAIVTAADFTAQRMVSEYATDVYHVGQAARA
ncbi:MAG: alpha-glucan family phosphorylase [Chloroflexi bacterium]|nr:alpha-glucan family phosphorylase [Chloroflexota bacterium]